jgi:hypothetical protein
LRRWGRTQQEKNDEPPFSLAMTVNNAKPVPNAPDMMASLGGVSGLLRANVVRGNRSFKKYGREVTPRLCHFTCRAGPYGYVYQRERSRLKLARSQRNSGGHRLVLIGRLLFHSVFATLASAMLIAKDMLRPMKRKIVRILGVRLTQRG